jgi:glycine/D-amino acid oxidase-like deaminating enzyme
MFIWSDRQTIPWDADEAAALRNAGRDELVGEMPVFCHGRPEGGAGSPYVLALWEYHDDRREPEWPIPEDPLYPEVVLRGLTTMVPEMARYLDHLPRSTVDGGYYSKTPENRPLIGPAGPEGFHLMAGMSGFGVMVSAGAADLLGAHVTGAPLPEYAEAFLLDRYQDPDYLTAMSEVTDTGQL